MNVLQNARLARGMQRLGLYNSFQLVLLLSRSQAAIIVVVLEDLPNVDVEPMITQPLSDGR